ncbi:MAG: hypothetical protein JSW60_07515 [Thermoplasmatales archaeon]|nr:MAG: hypothetical protein JSW60_07515 [Thermoplasmatales archaeon]
MSKNYIFSLADSFYLLNKEMNYDIAIACSSSLISACLPNIRIPTSKGLPLSLDEMDAIIGISGVVKSIPLQKIIEIAKKLGLKLPTFTTTEGPTKYFSEKDSNGNYKNRPHGLIINDEMSRKFKESKHKDYAAGTIEQYASFYDRNLEETYLVKDGLRDPQQPSVSVIAATITNFLPEIPDHFFSQGLAGRFNWIYCDDIIGKDYNDDFDITKTKNYEVAEEQFDQHIEKLKKLYEQNPPKPVYMIMEPDTNTIFKKFDKEVHQQWQQSALHNLWACDYQFLKRLPEMAIKQAGRYAVGRCIDDIIEDGFDGLTIIKEDMEYGIHRMNVSKGYLEKIFNIRREGVQRMRAQKKGLPLKRTYSKEHVTGVLARLGRANTKQWQKESGISDTATFNKYRDEAIKHGMVREVDKSKITKKVDRMRFGADSPATKIWEPV